MAKHSQLAVLTLALLAALAMGCGGDPDKSGGDTGGSGGTNTPIGRAGSGGGGDGGGGAGGEGGTVDSPVQIETVRPPRGAVAGGDAVIIKGKGFLDRPGRPDASTTRVSFGTNPAVKVKVIDDATLNVTTPPGNVGVVDVTISNALGEATCADCFQFLGPVELRSIEPSEGPLHGGSPIVLRGQGLREGMLVTFGERAALDVELQEDGSLRALLPPASQEGLVDVRVFDADGQGWLRKGFNYVARLRIDTIDPPGGPVAGGNRIEIKGSGFTASSQVFFAGTAAATTWEAAGRLVAIAPQSPVTGPVELEVRTQTSTTTATYAYYDPADTTPRLYAVSPQSGPIGGGTVVTLVGTGLDRGLLAVRFDGNLASDASATSPNLVKVISPSGAAPTAVNVEARVAAGADELLSAFRYVASIGVQSVSPASGPVEGGTSISVTGVDFPAGARLFIGALEATNVVRRSPTLITAVTPRGTVGKVPVRVVSPDDEASEGVLVDGFAYEGTFSFSRLEPTLGARAGGAKVTLRGSGFYAGMPVAFGANLSAQVEVLDPFTAIVVTPAGNSGIVDVTAGPADTVHVTLPQAFTYFDPTNSSGGSSGGPLNGTLNITVLNGDYYAYGEPLEDAEVILGSDDGTEIRGTTNVRGQVTISSPLLVKPQTVTISKAKFESATVVKQSSENLTVYLDPNEGDPPTPSPNEPQPYGLVTGKVWGFKLPANRVLRSSERALAKVGYSYSSVFYAPPFGEEVPLLDVPEEGGSFTFGFLSARRLAVYAIFGILDENTGVFEPLLMGVSRGVEVEVSLDGPTVTTEVILDTRLNLDVPVTLTNPPGGGAEIFSYIDLGSEGVIPVGETLTFSSTALLQKLPALAGENFLFQTWGYKTFGYYPFSVMFRRQAGDLRDGLTIGPMMGTMNVVEPTVIFGGAIEWTLSSGPAPAIAIVRIDLPGMFGPTPFWHMVLPGTERRVTLPASVVADLRSKLPPGTALRLTIILGREPVFDYDEWNYRDMGLDSFTSFSYTVQTIWL